MEIITFGYQNNWYPTQNKCNPHNKQVFGHVEICSDLFFLRHFVDTLLTVTFHIRCHSGLCTFCGTWWYSYFLSGLLELDEDSNVAAKCKKHTGKNDNAISQDQNKDIGILSYFLWLREWPYVLLISNASSWTLRIQSKHLSLWCCVHNIFWSCFFVNRAWACLYLTNMTWNKPGLAKFHEILPS